MSDQASFFDRFNQWMRASIGLKVFTIAFLVLILLIPLNMVEDLVWERENYRQQAMMEVSGTWGNHQSVTALVLTIPFHRYSVISNEDGSEKTVQTTYHAHFLPATLDIEGTVEPEKRKRGIYEVVVYSSELDIHGSFDRPDFSKLGIDEDKVQWDQAKVSLGLSDLRSIQNEVSLDWADETIAFEPGIPDQDAFYSGISAPVHIAEDRLKYDFDLNLLFNGSNGLQFSPLGKVSQVKLASNWPDPKFDGAFLPGAHDVSSEGFTAEWEVLQLNRNYPQEFEGTMNEITASNFGVELLMPVDHYMKSTRAIKYGLMFIALTFLVYFFSQIQHKVRIHPVQYLIVGLAICLFFTILIALSEHIGFDKAYLVGSAAIITMISLYSLSIFKEKRLTAILAGILIVLYGFIYIIIQMQDYSLLIGSIGLFIILGLVMYISRNIDWYRAGEDV